MWRPCPLSSARCWGGRGLSSSSDESAATVRSCPPPFVRFTHPPAAAALSLPSQRLLRHRLLRGRLLHRRLLRCHLLRGCGCREARWTLRLEPSTSSSLATFACAALPPLLHPLPTLGSSLTDAGGRCSSNLGPAWIPLPNLGGSLRSLPSLLCSFLASMDPRRRRWTPPRARRSSV